MKALPIFLTALIFAFALSPTTSRANPQAFKWLGLKTSFEDSNQKSIEQSIQALVLGMAEVSLSETADRSLQFSLSKLDRKILMTAEVKGPGDKIDARTLTLSSLDELDAAVPRALQAIIEGVPIRDTASRGQIYGAEKQEPSKLRSSSGFQFSVGGAVPLGGAFDRSDTMTSLGFGYLWDVDNAMVEVRTDLMFGERTDSDNDGLGSLSIGAHYVLWQNRFASLFAGGEFGFGWASAVPASESYEQEAHGFMLAADVGTNLIRYADINVDFRLRGTMLAAKLDDHLPFSLGLALGLRY